MARTPPKISIGEAATLVDRSWNILCETKCLMQAAEIGVATNDELARLNKDLIEVIRACESIVSANGKSGLKRCQQCGGIFIGPSNQQCCSTKCHSSRATGMFKDKIDNDQALKIYTRAYRTRHSRLRNGIMTEDEFQDWYRNAKTKLCLVRSGDLSISDYQTWLDSDLKRQKRRVNIIREVENRE